MWGTITLVTSGLTLVAFLAAAISAVSKVGLRRDRELIQNANPADRSRLISQAMERFSIDGDGIKSEKARERLLLEQMRTRISRYTRTLVASLIAFTILSLLAGFTVYVHYSSHIENLPAVNSSGSVANEPTVSPDPTKKPAPTVAPGTTEKPAEAPKPTAAPDLIQKPVVASEPTVAPEPTVPEPAVVPRPTNRKLTRAPQSTPKMLLHAKSDIVIAGRGKWRKTFLFKAGRSYDFQVIGTVKSNAEVGATFALKLCSKNLDFCEKEQSTALTLTKQFQDLGVQSEAKYAVDTTMIVVLENGSANPVYLGKGTSLIVAEL